MFPLRYRDMVQATEALAKLKLYDSVVYNNSDTCGVYLITEVKGGTNPY